MSLTEKQRQCRESVARGGHPPFKITTVASLERKGLVEHTSLGWRVTPEGRELLRQKTAKPPRKAAAPRKRKPREQASPREARQALTPKRANEEACGPPPPSSWTTDDLKPLAGDLPGVTVSDEAEALFYFGRIDERLAEAWKRDVAVHEGPITIRRVLSSGFGSTHYAYVDRRLLWYLRHDPSDPLGARWEGYLRSAGDVPRGAIAVFVGRDVMARKCPPQLTEGAR